MRGIITGPELARIEDVSPSTIWRWTQEHFIPEECCKRAGKKRGLVYYSVEALQRHGFLTDKPALVSA